MNQLTLTDRPVATDALPTVVEQEPEMSTELATIEHEDALTTFASIGVSMEAAVQLATRLSDIIKQRELSKRIGTKDHIFVEAWCACASMCGLAPRTAWCRRITGDNGAVLGYEARVEVVRLATNEVIGAAETECWLDEKLGNRVRWTEKHAAKSMAQTRGTSKAIAQILRWIPILAGYSGTPAEEADSENGLPEAHENPERNHTAPQSPARGDRVSRDQIESLVLRFKKAKGDGVTAAEWSKFACEAANRVFDVAKPGQWTPADIDRVHDQLVGRFDA